MAYEFKATRRVEFSETDMAGIMHYSNFFKFMETAEHGFYRSLGFSVVMPGTNPRLGWPRVHAHCDFHKPLRFEDEVVVQLLVKEMRSKSISYLFRFWKQAGEGMEEVAWGGFTIVCVEHLPEGGMRAVRIPESVTKMIEEAPREMLGRED